MKILVTYFSRSGQTKKVAEAIYEAIPYLKEIQEMNHVECIDEYDITFVGFPIEKYGPGDNVREWLTRIVAGKNVAIFVTHAAPRSNRDLHKWLDACSKAANTANLLSQFNCQGELSEAFVNMASMIPDPMVKAFARERPNTMGHPTTDELDEAKTWCENVLRMI